MVGLHMWLHSLAFLPPLQAISTKARRRQASIRRRPKPTEPAKGPEAASGAFRLRTRRAGLIPPPGEASG